MRIDAKIGKLGTTNPEEVKSIALLKKELEYLSSELAKGHISIVEGYFIYKLGNLEKIVIERLNQD